MPRVKPPRSANLRIASSQARHITKNPITTATSNTTLTTTTTDHPSARKRQKSSASAQDDKSCTHQHKDAQPNCKKAQMSNRNHGKNRKKAAGINSSVNSALDPHFSLPAVERVPVEVWFIIFSTMGTSQVAPLSMVSKSMLNVCRDRPRWRYICEENYLPGLKRKYKTHMALACSESYYICDLCDGRSKEPVAFTVPRIYLCPCPAWMMTITSGGCVRIAGISTTFISPQIRSRLRRNYTISPTCCVWSTDSNWIAFGCSNGTVQLLRVGWSPDKKDPQQLQPRLSWECAVRGFHGPVNSLAWHPVAGKRQFVTGSSDCSVCVWKLTKVDGTDNVQVQLVWGSFSSRFVAAEARLMNAKGLDGMQSKFLQERGADNGSPPLLAEEAEKDEGITDDISTTTDDYDDDDEDEDEDEKTDGDIDVENDDSEEEEDEDEEDKEEGDQEVDEEDDKGSNSR